jgi:hypothetical protein
VNTDAVGDEEEVVALLGGSLLEESEGDGESCGRLRGGRPGLDLGFGNGRQDYDNQE